jgi:hypothetical protein
VVDVYWVERGLSLICIALNESTHQNEYILFEPPSPLEYEILEREKVSVWYTARPRSA